VGACLLVGDGAWSVVAVGRGVVPRQTVRRCPRRKRELDLAVRLLVTARRQASARGGGGAAAAVAGLGLLAAQLPLRRSRSSPLLPAVSLRPLDR
jgi:hypothetical protein